jgi:FkbM family methyltransferase
MVEWTGGRFRKAVAFEADPRSFGALEQMVERDEALRHRVRIVQQAVGREVGTLRFAASGLSSAAISAEGDIEVQCVPLDEALADEHPTYIKMDIEGAEIDALAGGAGVIRRDSPALAICAYHVQDHLWRIPLLIHEVLPDSRLLLRPYCANGWELVCYAIPADRPLDFTDLH